MSDPTWRIERNSPFRWWNKNRKKYNTGLIVSGILAFIAYIGIADYLIANNVENWDGEITIFNLLFQAFGYLVMIGIANLFYYLGPIFEKIINPTDVDKYRNLTFNLGFWFSCLLPFLIPLILIIKLIKI